MNISALNHAVALRALPVGVLLLVASCAGGDGHESIRLDADPETFPTMRTLNVRTLISDSGYTRYNMTTPLWLVYDEAREPRWVFPQGVDIVRYDNAMEPDGVFRSDTATYFSRKRLWRFDRNVRMRNTGGDRFVTQQLFWDQNRQEVYSDSFIHIERQDRVIEGYGFVSDQSMTSYTVRRPTGIFPTSDFVRRDSTPAR